MSYWNHRVIHSYHEKTDSHTYQIHEVYYDDKGTIEGWTSAVEPFGETLFELREDIRYLMKAFQKPILKSTIENGEEVLIVDEEAPPINLGHYTEFLDRAWVSVDYIYQFLGSHPLLRQEKRLQNLYNNLIRYSRLLYQFLNHLLTQIHRK